MLTLFRDLVRSKVALVLIGLLILSLALFGVPDLFGSLMGNQLGSSLMRAESRTLETDDVDRYADSYIAMNRAEGGQLTKPQMAENGQLGQVIQLLSDFKTRAAYIDQLGLNSSIREAAEWVSNLEPVKDEITGKLDEDLYAAFVSDRGYRRKKDFERVLLDDLSLNSVNAGLASAVSLPAGMTDLWTIVKSETRNVAFLTVDLADLPEAVTKPTEDDVNTFYEESSDRLLEPERRQFSVLAVTPEDFYHKISVNEQDLRSEYDAQVIRFSDPSVRTYQVLSFQNRTEAMTAIGFLLGGGDPTATRGNLQPEMSARKTEITDSALAEAVFSAQPDLWQGPTQTSSGAFALIRVTEDVPGERTPFEDVKDTIREELIASRAERLFDRVIDDIDDAIGAGLPLEQMAETIGSPVFTYPAVDDRGFTTDGLFIRNLFSLPGALTTGFELFPEETSSRKGSEDVHYIIRADRIVEPTIPELEKIREPLTEALFARKKQEALTAFAESLKQNLESGQSTLSSIGEQLDKTITRPPIAIGRTTGAAQGIPQQVLSVMFATPLDGVFMAPGGEEFLIGVVEGINIPDVATLASMRVISESEMNPTIEDDLEDGLARLAEENMKVSINDKMIDAYIAQYQVTE